MTKSDLIHHIVTTWSGENKINIWTWEQQKELVKELSKYLMLKKKSSSQALPKSEGKDE